MRARAHDRAAALSCSLRRCCRARGRAGMRAGAGLSQSRRDHRRAGGAGRALQPVRAADRQQARAAAGQAVHRREPAGRELDRRRDVGDPRAARRLYADGGATPAGSPTNVSLHKSLPYDPVKDFAPIALIARIPEVLVVNAALPVHSLADLAKLAKATPGGLTYGSAGAGTGAASQRRAARRACSASPLTHVPYKGMSPAINDVAGGHIPFMFSPIPFAQPLAQAGKLRMLGVTTAERIEAIPDVPPLDRDRASRGSTRSSWFMLVAAGRHAARHRREAAPRGARHHRRPAGAGGVHPARPRAGAVAAAGRALALCRGRNRALGRYRAEGRDGGIAIGRDSQGPANGRPRPCLGPILSIDRPRRSAPRIAQVPERWQSGRLYRTRNAAYGQPYRGFESHPLRHYQILEFSLPNQPLENGPVIWAFGSRPVYVPERQRHQKSFSEAPYSLKLCTCLQTYGPENPGKMRVSEGWNLGGVKSHSLSVLQEE